MLKLWQYPQRGEKWSVKCSNYLYEDEKNKPLSKFFGDNTANTCIYVMPSHCISSIPQTFI